MKANKRPFDLFPRPNFVNKTRVTHRFKVHSVGGYLDQQTWAIHIVWVIEEYTPLLRLGSMPDLPWKDSSDWFLRVIELQTYISLILREVFVRLSVAVDTDTARDGSDLNVYKALGYGYGKVLMLLNSYFKCLSSSIASVQGKLRLRTLVNRATLKIKRRSGEVERDIIKEEMITLWVGVRAAASVLASSSASIIASSCSPDET